MPGPCPEWCTLAPGHDWDHGSAGVLVRSHQGPQWGHHVWAEGSEHQAPGAPATFTYSAGISGDDLYDLTAAQARALAEQLVAAAAWVEAHQG